MDRNELKLLRLELKLTQSQMADKLGITRDGVAKIESGKCNMSKSVEMLALNLKQKL